jgi:hypothetical protein
MMQALNIGKKVRYSPSMTGNYRTTIFLSYMVFVLSRKVSYYQEHIRINYSKNIFEI